MSGLQYGEVNGCVLLFINTAECQRAFGKADVKSRSSCMGLQLREALGFQLLETLTRD